MPNENSIPSTTVPIHFDLSSSHRHIGDDDYRPTRRARAAYSGEAPAPWSAGQIIALIVACVLGLALLTGLGALIANGGSFTCDAVCWQAKKQMVTDAQTTARAIANSDANARAGFGNDDETTKQKAVLPRAKIEYRDQAPNITIHQAPPTVINAPAAQAPVVSTVTPGCGTRCGGSMAGVATTNGAPAGRCFAPAGSRHAGEMGYLWPDKSCHKLPPV